MNFYISIAFFSWLIYSNFYHNYYLFYFVSNIFSIIFLTFSFPSLIVFAYNLFYFRESSKTNPIIKYLISKINTSDLGLTSAIRNFQANNDRYISSIFQIASKEFKNIDSSKELIDYQNIEMNLDIMYLRKQSIILSTTIFVVFLTLYNGFFFKTVSSEIMNDNIVNLILLSPLYYLAISIFLIFYISRLSLPNRSFDEREVKKNIFKELQKKFTKRTNLKRELKNYLLIFLLLINSIIMIKYGILYHNSFLIILGNLSIPYFIICSFFIIKPVSINFRTGFNSILQLGKKIKSKSGYLFLVLNTSCFFALSSKGYYFVLATSLFVPFLCICFYIENRLRKLRLLKVQQKMDEIALEISESIRKPNIDKNKNTLCEYALYLRSFSTTNKLETKGMDLETTIAYSLRKYMPVIALGYPGEHIGAGRIKTDDYNWKVLIRQLIEKSTLILLIPSAKSGTLWEINYLKQHGYLEKAVLIMPFEMPFDDKEYSSEWNSAVKILRKQGIYLPSHFKEGLIFRLSSKGIMETHAPFGINYDKMEKNVTYHHNELSADTNINSGFNLSLSL